MMLKEMLVFAAAVLLFAGCDPEEPRDFGFDETVVVLGNEPTAEFAAQELNDIVTKSAGRGFDIGVENRCRCRADGLRRIFIGRSAEAEAIIGARAFEELGEEESAVFAKGDDLFLVGGDPLGVLWAVYDFCEDSLGYRWYLQRPDGEKIVKTDVVRYNGVPTRRRPKFRGYRCTNWRPENRLFRLRNRVNVEIEHFCKDYRLPMKGRIPGHGFRFFIPAGKREAWDEWAIPKDVHLEYENFKKHPEWFSLMPDGTRNGDHQLCLSNPGCRQALASALLQWMRSRGPGVYQVGVNDSRFGRLCHCTDCLALEKKYNTTGGPLWDCMVELCGVVKREFPQGGYYVESLAYDGLDQTEKAPDNVVFPDNFVPNIAYIHICDRPIKQLPDKPAPEGEMVNYWQNTLKWCSITKHQSYWYYGTACPMVVYRRMQEEFRQLHEAGIESVFTDGRGGGYEFGDMTARFAAKLLYDPDCDIRKELEDACAFKYGPAAPEMLEFIDSLERTGLDYIGRSGTQVLNTGHCYQGMNFLKGKDIAAWRAIFARAEEKVKVKGAIERSEIAERSVGLREQRNLKNSQTLKPSNPQTFYEENVRNAKLVVDLFTVVLEKRVRAEAPECVFDTAAVRAEGMAIAEAYGKKYLRKEQKNEALKLFEEAEKELAYYGNLKDENALPKELASYQAAFVTRLLPIKNDPYRCDGNVREGKYCSEPDAQSVCGYRVVDDIPDNRDLSNGIPYYIWDAPATRQRMGGRIPLSAFKKDQYVLYKLGETELSPVCGIIFAEMWASPLAHNYLGRCYNPAYPKRRYEVFLSMKAEGPRFFPGDTRKNRLSFDQMFVCEVLGSGN